MKGKWAFYQDKADEWRWRLTASNGNIVGAAHEGYKSKASCIDNAIRHGYDNEGNIAGKSLGESDKWEFYQDKASEWRWRRTATNGEVVGAATESYKSKPDCISNASGQGYKAT